jgi:hypothetical protein
MIVVWGSQRTQVRMQGNSTTTVIVAQGSQRTWGHGYRRRQSDDTKRMSHERIVSISFFLVVYKETW